MTDARQRLGRGAEAFVAARLERAGVRVLARNQRTSSVRGEIDLIALDGDALVFLEVKARTDGAWIGPERPVLAVGHRKRRKLRSLALAWLRDHPGSVPRHASLRFDVAGVRVDPQGAVTEIEYLEAAF
jgi:putative endonuclease